MERRINTLMGTLEEKERDLISTGQKLQEVLAATTRSEQTTKQLEEAMQRYLKMQCLMCFFMYDIAKLLFLFFHGFCNK